MSGDPLENAVRALRDETLGGADAADRTRTGTADATRMRIVGSLRARRRRRVMAVRASVVLLAATFGGVAWAAATGRLPSFVTLTELLGAADPTPVLPARNAPVAATVPVAANVPVAETGPVGPATVPTDDPAAMSEREPVAPVSEREPVAPVSEREPASAVSASPPASTVSASAPAAPVSEREPASAAAGPGQGDAAADALYQKAHALHFEAQNYSGARAAWDAYLAAAPRGRFASFAHYNRALCLVRLGRTEEARRALTPFATGAFGGYRQKEAQSLLDLLNSTGPR